MLTDFAFTIRRQNKEQSKRMKAIRELVTNAYATQVRI
jgi:hypothetical protein